MSTMKEILRINFYYMYIIYIFRGYESYYSCLIKKNLGGKIEWLGMKNKLKIFFISFL